MRKAIFPLSLLLGGLFGLVTLTTLAADGIGTVTVQLPEETTRFMPGPGLETVQLNCVKCHSADYIYMQPPLTKEQWQATVIKMKKVFGAPIEDKDIETMVNYLMSQNGKS